MTMEREISDVIDLGAASTETKGIGAVFHDEDVLQTLPGLTNE